MATSAEGGSGSSGSRRGRGQRGGKKRKRTDVKKDGIYSPHSPQIRFF